ncbi:MAG: DPP IV N-terminal domain-containing protein, partial [Bacteroidales bacterium]|nr:DPP IV N-terminal domain-containing protein [Bacteroidales bacterium]
MKNLSVILGLITISLFSISISAQEKKTLTPDDYDQWQSLRSAVISQNGEWVAYQVTMSEGNDTLYMVNTSTDTVYKEAFGTRMQFTADSKFATYLIGVSKKEQEKLKKKKSSVHYKLAILNLENGKKDIYPEVSGVTLPKEGSHLLLSMYKPKESKAKGTDKVLYDLTDKSMRTLGNITSISFNKTGNLLAYITEPANALGYGVEVIDLKSNIVRVLASDTSSFSKLTWEKEGNALAFFHLLKNKDYKDDAYEIIAYRNVGKNWNKEVFNPCQMDGFPEMMRVNNSSLQWAEDNSSLFFGIQDQELSAKKKEEISKKKEEGDEKEDVKGEDSEDGEKKGEEKGEDGEKKGEELPGVDVWHWKDSKIQPRQKMTYSSDKNFSYLCMWGLDENSFRQIADSTMRKVRLTGDQKNAIVYTEKPYEPQFRMTYADYYFMDLKTGDKKELLKNFTGYISPSPDGKFLLYFKDRNWYSYDIETAKHVNLTGNQGVPFWNIRDDHPAEVRPSWGLSGWTKDDKYALINDEYDIWAFKPDGSGAMRLTQGRS